MTELKRWERLRELALAHKAWIRTADAAVTDDGRRVSPYPELAEILADYERLREALEKCKSNYCGYVIRERSEYEQVMKDFYAHICKVDKIVTEALHPEIQRDMEMTLRRCVCGHIFDAHNDSYKCDHCDCMKFTPAAPCATTSSEIVAARKSEESSSEEESD